MSWNDDASEMFLQSEIGIKRQFLSVNSYLGDNINIVYYFLIDNCFIDISVFISDFSRL